MKTFERLWDRRNRTRLLAVSAGMIIAIALVDWRTLPYESMGFFYFFPTLIAAGFLPRVGLVALGVGCAVLSEAFSSLDATWRAGRLTFATLAFVGCGLFVSELVRNRRLTLETQQRLRALVETSPAAIVIADPNGNIEMGNQAANQMLATSGNNLIGQPIARFVPALTNASHLNGTELSTSMRCQAQKENSEVFLAEVWFSTYDERGATKLAAIIGDVSEEQVSAGEAIETKLTERAELTPRQIAVLRLILGGSTNDQIASKLDMTSSAVKNTLQQLFSKAGVHNRSQMVRAALERYRDLL